MLCVCVLCVAADTLRQTHRQTPPCQLVATADRQQLDWNQLDDNGPQGTSTPSPTLRRREALPTAAVPSLAAPPPPPSRPVFEPVVRRSRDQLFPVSAGLQLPLAHAQNSQLHPRKPDVISDVNDEVFDWWCIVCVESGQSNVEQGCIAVAHGSLSGICHVTPCAPPSGSWFLEASESAAACC